MVYNISKRRQYTGGSGGVESASANFNYPTSGTTTLTDSPAFTQRSESPNSGTYTYSSNINSGEQTITFTIQRPDQSRLNLTRSTNSSSVGNGLLVQSEIKNSSGGSMAKSVFTYANDPGGSPQVQSIITYDDTGTPTQVNFDYDSSGSIANKREFGFQQSGSWVVRRRTHVNYTTAGGADVPTEVDVYDAQLNTNDADDVLIAKTTYDVDVYNYAAPLTGLDDYGGTANPPGHDSAFNATYTNRGNITGETQWTDLTANTTIIRQSRLNIFGVVTIAQLSCCKQKSFTYSSSDNFANATQVTSGPSGGPQLTDTRTYDFNTSKTTGMTDPNGLQSSYQYDDELRPEVVNLPTGATGNATYDDADQSGTVSETYNDGGTIKTVTWTRQGDGWGHLTQTTDPAGNVVNYSYNNMGRLQSKTNPFPSGGTPGPSTTYQYDALGRRTVVTLPDGNTTQTSYSGSTVTSTDQVGRKNQGQSDGLGRLVTATEEDPSNGSLNTEHELLL
jgi:YD repeat-containing protein